MILILWRPHSFPPQQIALRHATTPSGHSKLCVRSLQVCAPKWKVEQLENELHQLKEKTKRRKKAEAEEGLLLARSARQEEELQDREARSPYSARPHRA